MRYFTLAGIFTGFNLFLIFNKLYEEDIYVRDPGVSVPIENPFLYSLFRIVQYRITSFL